MNKIIHNYWCLMRFDRPIGTILLLIPTAWALICASHGMPPFTISMIFIAGVIVMRAAGCVINDYADRNFDPHVVRTANRPIAAGLITPRAALICFFVLILIALSLGFLLNQLALLWAIPAGILAATYPFAKRFHSLPQAHLGVAFAWSIPMVYAAIQNKIPLEAWVLFAITVVWTIAYDTLYAMADRAEDVLIGVKSSAILFGQYDLKIIYFLYFLFYLLLFYLNYLLFNNLKNLFFLCILLSLLFGIRLVKLAQTRENQKLLQSFKENWILGLILGVGLWAEWLWK